MRARTAVAVVLVGAVAWAATATRAQPPVAPKIPEPKKPKLEPLDRTELDKRIARVVNEAIAAGVIVWQNERAAPEVRIEGTFRLYQGTLAAVVPLLDHRPELQKMAAYRLKQGSGHMAVEGAFLFREALDEIQKETAPALIVRPLWERLGGEAGVRAIAKDFVELAAKDPRANLTRGGKYKLDEAERKELQDRVAEGISFIARGPLKWGGLNDVLPTLLGLGLTGAELDTLTGHLVAAMQKNKVGDAEIAEVRKNITAFRNLLFKGK
jgi:hypothetical protein